MSSFISAESKSESQKTSSIGTEYMDRSDPNRCLESNSSTRVNMTSVDFLDELIEEHDIPTLDGLLLMYNENTFEYKDCLIQPHERLSKNRSQEDQLVIKNAKHWAHRKYFSVPKDDLDQEIELKLFIEEQKQGYRFCGSTLMTVCKNAATDYYRKEARWHEKNDLLVDRFPHLEASYETLLERYRKKKDEQAPGGDVPSHTSSFDTSTVNIRYVGSR